MKDYQKLLSQYAPEEYTILRHEWGKRPNAVFNELVPIWSKSPAGHRIFIESYKHRNVKGLVSLLKTQGLQPDIVGKGPESLRVIQIIKNSVLELKSLPLEKLITFTFRDKQYIVNVGGSAFATRGLDEGTAFLLEKVLIESEGLSGKTIGDMGAGWGAISMVLATELPEARILAFEKDFSACAAAEENLAAHANVTFICADLAQHSQESLKAYYDKLDVVVSNPPFHATTKERNEFFVAIYHFLKKGGVCYFVLDERFAGRFKKSLYSLFRVQTETQGGKYSVWKCEKV